MVMVDGDIRSSPKYVNKMTDELYHKHRREPLTAAMEEMPFSLVGTRSERDTILKNTKGEIVRNRVAPCFLKELDRYPKSKKDAYFNYVSLTSKSKEEVSQKLAIYAVDVLRKRWKKAEPHIFYEQLRRNEKLRKKYIFPGNRNNIGHGGRYYKLNILDTLKRFKFW